MLVVSHRTGPVSTIIRCQSLVLIKGLAFILAARPETDISSTSERTSVDLHLEQAATGRDTLSSGESNALYRRILYIAFNY
jgi:hypothetical protein